MIYDYDDKHDGDRCIVFQKVQKGAELNRNDLQLILNVLSENFEENSYYKACTGDGMLSNRVQGYKKIGKESAGSMGGTRIKERDYQIMEDYEGLTNKDNAARITPENALKKLCDESLIKYGRSLGDRAITNAITRGRKYREYLNTLELPDF